MLLIISRILKGTANLILKIEKRISSSSAYSDRPMPTKQSIRVIPWFKENGDKTYRQIYNLNESSLVFDLGGYEGQWASGIFCKYACTIHIFEPYIPYADNIQNEFLKNGKIHVHRFGLAQKTYSSKLSISADASSIFKTGENVATVEMIKASDFIDDNKIERIDLMKINIEGGEYDLLDHLIENGIVAKIDNIQVQFHDFVENAESRMRSIQLRLSHTHYLTYQFEFVWENWARKKINGNC